jgi:hypothetical protein
VQRPFATTTNRIFSAVLRRGGVLKHLTWVLLAGCLPYAAPVFARAPRMPAHPSRVGPVDVAVQPMRSDEIPENAVMIDYEFGNRTDRSLEIDMGSPLVELDGEPASLWDPRDEVQIRRMGPAVLGHERLVYIGRGAAHAEVCVTLLNFVMGVHDDERRCFDLRSLQ